ncbi:MAG: hypothetical protein K0R65_641 [Crocinitomicaceae bacterium]|jgi:hypothetical protein|nr:hypothetical protein [Crocinitomicaceae bacterium]
MRDELFAAGIIAVIFAIGAIIAYVFYLLTLQRLMELVSPKNRLVPPSNVWLMFIPFFNLVYAFVLYPKISDSVMEEFADRKLDTSGDFARNLGIAMALLGLGYLFRFLGPLALLGSLASLANLIIWIIFWVKMNQYKEQLKNSGNFAGISISNNPDLLD